MPSKSTKDDKPFMTPTKFSEKIENMVKESHGDINYIEAIVCFCDDNEIEIESVPKLLSKPLKEKVKNDAQQLNYMKRTTRGVLPIYSYLASLSSNRGITGDIPSRS